MGSLDADIPDVSQRGVQGLKILLAKMGLSIGFTMGSDISPTEIPNNTPRTLNSHFLLKSAQFAFPAVCCYQRAILKKIRKEGSKREKEVIYQRYLYQFKIQLIKSCA